MEGGRIEADGDSEVTTVAQDQFQLGRRLGDLMSHDGRQRSGTDVDGQKGGHIGRSRRRGWRRVTSARAPRGESESEAIEPITEGMDRDAAEFAELDMGQARPTEVG